jgi:hypothetical protein
MECDEEPQTTPVPHPNQAYIDDLGSLLKVATHPRSTLLLEQALEEAKREGLPNGDREGGVENGGEELKEVKTAATPSHAPPVAKSGRTVPLVYSTRISQYGWDQTPKVIKIYITGISDISQASKEDMKAEFKSK